MTTPVQQLAFPFASLDFEGYTILTVDQIATKLRFTAQHILNLVDQGEIVAIDGKSKKATRRECRIAIEEYRAFIMKRLTGPASVSKEFISQLPRDVRLALITELKESLRT